ncbi:MAG: hypothetical protein QXN95_03380 [Candidatus Bathyarchaeia archaeon]
MVSGRKRRKRSLEALVDKQLLIQLRLENLLASENLRRDRERVRRRMHSQYVV